jgi:hypothetical protein
MKKTSLVMALALISASVVTALPSEAYACYCEARSAYAWAWGSGSCSYAKRRALAECAKRTPRGYWCYVTFCR